jgi:thiol-disulfide isomerase/thioredoxin
MMEAAMQHSQPSSHVRGGRHGVRAVAIASMLLAAGWASAQPTADPAPAIQPDASADATATDAPEGSALFTKAADALKKAQSISYRVRYRATGGMEQYSAAVEADVRMLRDSTALGYTNGWAVRSIGSGLPKPNAERMDFDVAWVGNTVEFISHEDKKVVERRSSREARSTAFSVANSARLQELFAAKPFSKEVAANAQHKMLERTQVGGVECDVVEVTFSDRKGKSVWAFGVDDHLPRRLESVIENVMMTGSTVLELDEVRVDTSRPPSMSRSSVRVDVPEGYAEDRPAKPTPAAAPMAAKAPESKDAEGKPVDAKSSEIKLPEEKPEPKDAPIDGVPEKTEDRGMPQTKPADEPEAKAAESVSNASIEPPLTAGPDFDLRASTGGRVSLASLRGRVVVLEFGGSWCLALRESRGELDQLAARFEGKPVSVLALSARDKQPDVAMERFRSQNHTYPLLVEADAAAAAYRIRAYPTYVVLDGEGTIIKVVPGFTKGETIETIGGFVTDHLASRRPGA